MNTFARKVDEDLCPDRRRSLDAPVRYASQVHDSKIPPRSPITLTPSPRLRTPVIPEEVHQLSPLPRISPGPESTVQAAGTCLEESNQSGEIVAERPLSLPKKGR